MRNNYFKCTYIVHLIIALAAWLVCPLLSNNNISAQRAFCATEEGFMKELKSGEYHPLSANIKLPKGVTTTVSSPLKIYLVSDYDIDIKELILQCVATHSRTQNRQLYSPINLKKHAKLQKVEDNIFLLEIDDSKLKTVGSSPVLLNYLTFTNEVCIAFKPNKKNKSNGASTKAWFLKRTEVDYEPSDTEWTENQAVNAINEIIATRQSSIQLFASILPQEKNVQDKVQYVIVPQPQQNPAQPLSDNQNKTIPDSDIDIDIPYSPDKTDKTFALIIANENYNKVSSVPFANKDGKKVEEYFSRTLGIDKGHISLVEDATLNDMKYELKRLSKISEAYEGDISILVYYCGHGIPDEKNGNGYLLPVDGYGNDVSTAYSTQELYDFLGNLKAKKVLLFMDACFSGTSKEGSMLVAARGIAIKATNNEPTGNLIAFSACQGDETAYSYDEKGHGLMTYYFLKKIKESKGNVTLGELEEYITDNVSKTAIVTNGKPQTPSTAVSPNLQDSWRKSTLLD